MFDWVSLIDGSTSGTSSLASRVCAPASGFVQASLPVFLIFFSAAAPPAKFLLAFVTWTLNRIVTLRVFVLGAA